MTEQQQEQQNRLLWKSLEQVHHRVAVLESKLLAPQEIPRTSPPADLRITELERQLGRQQLEAEHERKGIRRHTALLIESLLPTPPANLSECTRAGWNGALDKVRQLLRETFLQPIKLELKEAPDGPR